MSHLELSIAPWIFSCSPSHGAVLPAPPSVASRLLEEDADKAQDNVDDKEACLVPPDTLGQGQSLHQSPADLHTDHSADISRWMILLQKDCKQTYNTADDGICHDSHWQCTVKIYQGACRCIALPY